MQAIMETSFDVIYLVTVLTLGLLMIRKGHPNKEPVLFGVMAVTLGLGDAFHLVPRAYALCTSGLEQFTYALGMGKFITSITMTAFYVLLYYVWRIRYQVQGRRGLTGLVYFLSGLRILLCLFPQNAWTSSDAPLSWAIYRNLPFAALGLLMIFLFYQSATRHRDRNYRFMWLTIVLSFAFYIPVVLFADTIPIIGMLMIPKTCAYVWTVLIGYLDFKKQPRLGQ